jgi:hypothetical protein
MNLTDDNFIIYAAKCYDMKKSSSDEEFQKDLKRLVFLKKLFVRYEKNDDLQIRLILNHIIILYNCFGIGATPMLFFRLEGYHHVLKPFIMFLGFLPDKVTYDGIVINTKEILLDPKIVSELRKI